MPAVPESIPLHSLPQKFLAPSVEDRPKRTEEEERVYEGRGRDGVRRHLGMFGSGAVDAQREIDPLRAGPLGRLSPAAIAAHLCRQTGDRETDTGQSPICPLGTGDTAAQWRQVGWGGPLASDLEDSCVSPQCPPPAPGRRHTALLSASTASRG